MSVKMLCGSLSLIKGIHITCSVKEFFFIYHFKPSNCITEFSELTGTPSRKYIYAKIGALKTR